MYSIFEINNIIQGTHKGSSASAEIRFFSIDSRTAFGSEELLFFALQGAQHDGHQYIIDLIEKGVKSFVVSRDFVAPKGENLHWLHVDNTTLALQQLAAHHRAQFAHPVIAITGSNGKTIVKEWLGQILSQKYSVAKSPKSFNSQVGVPLSLLTISPNHNLAIMEAGISTTGEMSRLEQMIKPDMGIFTNIGTAHSEGFGSLSEKAREKSVLFQKCPKIIYCQDYREINAVLENSDGVQLLSWGVGDAHYLVTKNTNKERTNVALRHNGELQSFTIPFTDDASVENCLHCIVAALELGLTAEEIDAGLQGLNRVNMRFELKTAINNSYLIDDAYNNDLEGLQVALDYLSKTKIRSKRRLILSDILQSGLPNAALYAKVKELTDNYQLEGIIGIGENISSQKHLFDKSAHFFNTTDDFLKSELLHSLESEMILLKGARKFAFEKIGNALMQKNHGTVMEIDLEALTHNYNFYRSKLGRGVKMMVMVKALAYGSGSIEVATHLQYLQVDYLAVAYADEGVQLRKNGITTPILVMNTTPDTYHLLSKYRLEPEVFEINQLRALIQNWPIESGQMPVHLKIDTGMHRLGFNAQGLNEILDVIRQTPFIKVVSIFTHLAGADDPIHDEYTVNQLNTFIELANAAESILGYEVIKHALNSAGIVRFPDHQFDMVRLGIGLYGHEASGTEQQDIRQIATLKTVVSQVKKLMPGDTIGYSRKGVAHEPSEIATIAIGYADGYLRVFGNGRARVMAKGKLVPTIGNICMDMTMIDVTGLNVQAGDEVIIFGEKPTIADLAEIANTIPYEILTNISQRVKRVYSLA